MRDYYPVTARPAGRKEEAEFWDTHDITDFLDELQPAQVRFAKNLSEGITVRFDASPLTELRKQAKRKGIGPATPVRMWVLERLEGGATGK